MYVSRRGLIRVDSTQLNDEPLDLALGEIRRTADADYHPRAVAACLAAIRPILAVLAPPLWSSLSHDETVRRLLERRQATAAVEYLRRQWQQNRRRTR